MKLNEFNYKSRPVTVRKSVKIVHEAYATDFALFNYQKDFFQICMPNNNK
jgi:hypothetical protein